MAVVPVTVTAPSLPAPVPFKLTLPAVAVMLPAPDTLRALAAPLLRMSTLLVVAVRLPLSIRLGVVTVTPVPPVIEPPGAFVTEPLLPEVIATVIPASTA